MTIEEAPQPGSEPQPDSHISDARYDELLNTKAKEFSGINDFDDVEVVLRPKGGSGATLKAGMVHVKEGPNETGAVAVRIAFNDPPGEGGKIPSTKFSMEGKLLTELPDAQKPPGEPIMLGFLMKVEAPEQPKPPERVELTSTPETSRRRFLPRFPRRKH